MKSSKNTETAAGVNKLLKVRLHILFFLALPMLGMFWLAGNTILDRWRMTADMVSLGQFVHHLQRERGASALFVGSQEQPNKNILLKQRGLTDDARRDLNNILFSFDSSRFGADFKSRLDLTVTALNKLDQVRHRIDRLGMSAPQDTAYFTETIGELLGVLGYVAEASSDANIVNQVNAYVNYISSKERAVQERSVGADSIAAGRFSSEQYQLYSRILAEQDVFFDLFAKQATKELISFNAQTVKGRDVDEVMRIRQLIQEGGIEGRLGGTEASYWVKVTTARIDLMKQVEAKIANQLVAGAISLKGRAQAAFFITLFLAVGILVVAIFLFKGERKREIFGLIIR